MNYVWNFLFPPLAIACLCLWIYGFSTALPHLKDPEPFKLFQAESASAVGFVKATLMVPLTNLALLTCLAGLAGGVTKQWTVFGAPRFNPSQRVRIENPLAGMVRSFFVYFIFLAGSSFIAPTSGNGPITVDETNYLRLAGTLSVLGFIVAYDMSLLSEIIWGIRDKLRKGHQGP